MNNENEELLLNKDKYIGKLFEDVFGDIVLLISIKEIGPECVITMLEKETIRTVSFYKNIWKTWLIKEIE
jgi:hypothetical protein